MPREAIIGSWETDHTGTLTGRFAPNPNYRAIEDCDPSSLKPYIKAAALHNPKDWIVDMDERAEQLFPNIPDHLIHGWWYVNETGTITRKFRPSSAYNPAQSS